MRGRRQRLLLLLAIAVAAVAIWLALRPRPVPAHAVAPAPAPARAPAPAPLARAETMTTPEILDRLQPDEQGVPTQDVHRNELGPGDGTGIYAFPLAGTKPIKRGLVVPEGFELPPGYLRHYQTTDDGSEVPPILMFHPDFHPVDSAGRPIPLPADRIVPAEMAPQGMPIQLLDPIPVHPDLDEHGRPLR